MHIRLDQNVLARCSAAALANNCLLAVLLTATVLGSGLQPARATPCDDKEVTAFKECMADGKTAASLRVALCVSMSSGTKTKDECVLQGCTDDARSVREKCEGGSDRASLRDRLREALSPPPLPEAPEPAVQRCPAKDGLCYAVVLGATKCKVWRTMGRPLPPPYSFDGISSEEYVSVDVCPKDLICEFYRAYGSGMPEGCTEAVKLVPPPPATPKGLLPGAEASAPAVPGDSPPAMELDADIKAILGIPSEPRTPPLAKGVTPTTLKPVPSGHSVNPTSTITSRDWGDKAPGGVRLDVESKGHAEQLDRDEVLKLLRKPGS